MLAEICDVLKGRPGTQITIDPGKSVHIYTDVPIDDETKSRVQKLAPGRAVEIKENQWPIYSIFLARRWCCSLCWLASL